LDAEWSIYDLIEIVFGNREGGYPAE